MTACGEHCTIDGVECRHYDDGKHPRGSCDGCSGFEYPSGWFNKNLIKKLPDGQNAAIDESEEWLQLRVRKGTEWETALRELIKMGEA